MPRIVDYEVVLDRMTGQGLQCLYYNSGAFGFPEGVITESVGWTGPDDPTLRPAARSLARQVAPPYELNLAARVIRAWHDCLPGTLWLMPKSHWAYELDFGSHVWMPAMLDAIGIDAKSLQPRTNAAAIEFEASESASLQAVIETLLEKLFGSDFALAFPGRPVVCTLHHHKQVWWTSSDREIIAALGRINA